MQRTLLDLMPAPTTTNLSLKDMTRYRIERADGSFLEADLSADPPADASKWERYVHQDLLDGGKGMGYYLCSALHKEIRRGDVTMAVKYARLNAVVGGPSKLKQYIRGLLYEETRNFKLGLEWLSVRGVSWDGMARAAAASVKKWDLDSRSGLFSPYLSAYRDALDMPPVDSAHVVAAMSRVSTLDDAYRELWRARLASKRQAGREGYALAAALKAAIVERGVVAGGPAATATKFYAYKDHYGPKIIIEALFGRWDDAANAVHSDPFVAVPEDDVPTFPFFPDYVYDNHTRRGLHLLGQHLLDVAPECVPPTGVDLRYSGLLRGVGWREYARSTGIGVPWEAVPIPDDVWENIHWLDGYYYGRLYKKIKADVPYEGNGI